MSGPKLYGSSTAEWADAVQEAANRLAGVISRREDNIALSKELFAMYQQLVSAVWLCDDADGPGAAVEKAESTMSGRYGHQGRREDVRKTSEGDPIEEAVDQLVKESDDE